MAKFFSNDDLREPIRISIVEDDPVFVKMLERSFSQQPEYRITSFSSGEAFLKKLDENPHIVIVDYNLPDQNGLELIDKIQKHSEYIFTILVSGQNDVEVVVKAFKQGATDYVVKNENCLPVINNTIKNLSAQLVLKREVEFLRSSLDREKYTEIIGNSPPILKMLKLIQKAEKSEILVLLTGESGSGKELAARAVHFNGPRSRKPFIPVNMGAIPKDLIESELFGHEKGAFTGAIARRIGKFEEANGGTLFLDEIGDMDLSLQVKLLRILEDRQLVRIGSNNIIRLDIRIVVATNKDLHKEMLAGTFREELFYRLQGLLINMPTLRERHEDIPILVDHFIKEFAKRNQNKSITLSKAASKKLLNYSWPGNVRELKSVIERASLLSENGEILPDDIVLSSIAAQKSAKDGQTLEEYKLQIIGDHLNRFEQNVDLVAQKLNIGKATVYRALKKMEANTDQCPEM